MSKNVTVTNLKGGTGKTTASGLMALYFIEHQTGPVVVIDVDPQCGSTSLFLRGVTFKSTIKDTLVCAMEGDETAEIVRGPLVNVPGKPNLFVIPSDKRLTDMISGIPADLLLTVIQSARFSDETTVIIDTGTAQGMVGMGICAADMVLIPMMRSKQTIKPTTNTLQMIARFKKPILGLLPVAIGEAQWETSMLEKWQAMLDESADLKNLGGIVLPRLSYSKSLIRGAWTSLPFPQNFTPFFDAIFARVYGQSALPIPVAVEELENG